MKPESLNLDYMLTAETRRRAIPNLKKMYDLMGKPGMISLAGGTPNYTIFPFDRVGGRTLKPPFSGGVAESKLSKDSFQFEVYETSTSDNTKDADAAGDIELASALQYGAATGDPRLCDYLKSHSESLHDIGFSDWELILSVGNTFAWDAVLRTFCEPTDVLLFEEFTFPSALENAQARGCDIYAVKVDEHGLVPEDLEIKAQRYRPKLLYMIPTGQNPTGTLLPADRREKIVQIANRYGFLIVEDEPYYYLQMDAKTSELGTAEHRRQTYLNSLVKSLLHYDTEGRVIRLDSFSKIMAPGIRMGWITAQQRFTEALRRTMETSSSKPSGFAQSMVYAVLRRWGHPGFIDWLIGLKKEYAERRDLCCDALIANVKHKNKIIVKKPAAGMFFWFGIIVDSTDHEDTLAEQFFTTAGENQQVLVVPGIWCKVSRCEPELTGEKIVHFRGTFSSETKENVVLGAKRLAAAIDEFIDAHKSKAYDPLVIVSHADTI